ncbi:MAG: hypothetical protein KF881_10130 [Acidobacteria bacterium]|nr:hypothetical protein [Acidobacteriota bacterium]
MSKFTIPKYCSIVISALLAIFSGAGCAFDSGTAAEPRSTDFDAPQISGTIRSQDVNESSGVAASKCQSGVFWTHNDSGDGPFIYAFDPKGENLGTWRVAGAENVDWEDMATARTRDGRCFLYIADAGNNKLDRDVLVIYRVEEPVVTDTNTGGRKQDAATTAAAESMRFRYPDKVQDAETLMVDQNTGAIWVLTKRLNEPSNIYKLRWSNDIEVVTAEKVGTLSVPAVPNGLLTGGDISSDGRRAIVCDYARAYELTLPVDAASVDEIWKQAPKPVDLGKRQAGEAVAYFSDASSILATSEKLNSPIITARRK